MRGAPRVWVAFTLLSATFFMLLVDFSIVVLGIGARRSRDDRGGDLRATSRGGSEDSAASLRRVGKLHHRISVRI
jgi:hypothetical protein